MANEIQITSGMTATKGTLSLSRERSVLQVTMSGTRYDGGVQDVGFAAHEALALKTDFGTGGWAEFFNLDGTNYVELGRDVAGTFYPVAKLLAGEHCKFPVATNALYLKANTGSVKVEFTILER